jgi:hypothetical protein
MPTNLFYVKKKVDLTRNIVLLTNDLVAFYIVKQYGKTKKYLIKYKFKKNHKKSRTRNKTCHQFGIVWCIVVKPGLV